MNLEELQFESWKISEKSEWVKEQDLWNISENLKKAQQVRKTLQKITKSQKWIAFFLTLLVKEIQDDKLLSYIMKFFDNNHENILYIFRLLYPLMKIKLNKDIENKFSFKKEEFGQISDYVDYATRTLRDINWMSNEKINLVKEVIFYYNLWVLSNSKLTNKEKSDLEQKLLQTLKNKF